MNLMLYVALTFAAAAIGVLALTATIFLITRLRK